MARLLLAGETFTFVQTAASGLSVGQSSQYANGATQFLAAMQGTSFAIEQLPSERCEAEFPRNAEALKGYSAVILSDVSALTLLFTPESRQGHISVNRLRLLRDYVWNGGSLMMAGGYTSYQGMEGGLTITRRRLRIVCRSAVCLIPTRSNRQKGCCLMSLHPIQSLRRPR